MKIAFLYISYKVIYVLELEWRGEKAVLVIEIALQNIFLGCILFNFSRCIFITLCVRVGRCLNSHLKLEKSVTVQSQLSFSKWFKRKGFFFSRWSCSFLKGYLEVSLPGTFAQVFGKDDAETAGWGQKRLHGVLEGEQISLWLQWFHCLAAGQLASWPHLGSSSEI